MNNTLKVLAVLAATLLMSGCLSPGDKTKSIEATKDELKDKHLELRCTVATHGNGGVYAKIQDCDGGRLNQGAIDDYEFSVSGEVDDGSVAANRYGSMDLAVYPPKNQANSQTYTVEYVVENDSTGAFEIVVQIPVSKYGTGDYVVHFEYHNFKNTSMFRWGWGYEGAPDPAAPSDEKITVGKGGLW